MQKIYGPIQEGDIWRIRHNEELNIDERRGYCEIYKSPKDKMVGSCKENGGGGNAMKEDGRKKKRKTSLEMVG